MKAVAVAVGVVALSSLVSCADRTCTLIGCQDGLNVHLTGGTVGTKYDVELSTVTATPEVVPVMRCSVTRQTPTQIDIQCGSAYQQHTEFGDGIQIHNTSNENLLVTVSVDGAQVDQRMFEITYETRELNGPGCGTCTSAAIEVQLP